MLPAISKGKGISGTVRYVLGQGRGHGSDWQPGEESRVAWISGQGFGFDISTREDADPHGAAWVHIEVQDTGTGFTSEASRKAPEPFFTTRNVGLGLGLTVSRKIIETHHGRIEIARPQQGQSGTVTISLPLSPAA